ncbi:MAG: response regulator, partial [Dehalococcoidia bacterium]|nr:response regulator [Dehalococcoidia bacterium]
LEAIVQERTAELRRGYEILEREISEKEKVEEALRLSERYFRSLTEKAFDAILIVTADGTIRYASPSIEHVFGLNKDEIIGVRSLGYVHPDDRKRIAGIFMGLLHTHGAIEQVELRGHHADGSWRVFDAVYTNLLNDPVIAGITVNFRDVTERKEAQEQLQSLYKQERELRQRIEVEMKRRVEFTRALAHELKTPLTSVLASSDLLLARLQDEPSLGLARNINYAASNLNTRINELLDLVKSEVGILQLKLETMDSLQVLRDVVRSMTPLALRQGQSLTLDLPPSIPVLRADRTRFQQIVANLLSNAIKFTPDGGKISVRAKAKNSSLIVEISDTGPGISSKDQQRLFKPYQRLDGGTGNLGGLGIGLSLCKTLVELHDGQIWVRSRLGKGSVFGFSLPLNPDNRSVTESEREVKPWKALIIEDDAAIVDSLVLALDIEWPEVQVISTRSGEEGVDLIEVEDPDVVLLDLGLPDVSGFEVLRQIRLFSAVPIIILTVSSEEADMVKGLEWGADDYVVKPFRPKELIARMRSQLRKQTPPDEEAPIVSGPLRFDPSTCQLTIAGNEVSLTTIEGRIVENLMKNAGHVVTYSRLAEAVWDEDYPGSLETLRVHIRHLRAKVESDPGNPKIVLTKPGIGYLLARPS